MAIRYTEKGEGLHRRIMRQGLRLAQGAGGVWLASDEAAVQAIIDGYTLADAKADRKREVDRRRRGERELRIRDVDPSEQALRIRKWVEAIGFTGVEPIDARDAQSRNLLALWLEAQTRGVSVADLAQRVITRANQALLVEARVDGAAGKHKDAIDAAADFAAVAAYDIETGWPP